MKSLSKRLSVYTERAVAWGQFLNGEINALGIEGSAEEPHGGIREFASFELCLTLVHAKELLYTYRNLYGDSAANFAQRRSTLDNLAATHRPFIEKFISKGLEFQCRRVLDIIAQPLKVDALVDVFGVFLEVVAVRSGQREFSREARKEDDHDLNTLVMEAASALDESAKAEFADSIRAILANRWLYPWVKVDETDTAGSRYWAAFSIAGLIDRENKQMQISGLTKFEEQMPKHLWNLTQRSVERMGRMVAQDGYESAIDTVRDGARPWSEHEAGEDDIAVIPGKEQGNCRTVLFAFAGPGTGRNGSKRIMEQVRRYLINCSDTVKVVIFFAPLTDIGNALSGSFSDIQAHLGRGGLKSFVPVAIFNDVMTAIDWKK